MLIFLNAFKCFDLLLLEQRHVVPLLWTVGIVDGVLLGNLQLGAETQTNLLLALQALNEIGQVVVAFRAELPLQRDDAL